MNLHKSCIFAYRSNSRLSSFVIPEERNCSSPWSIVPILWAENHSRSLLRTTTEEEKKSTKKYDRKSAQKMIYCPRICSPKPLNVKDWFVEHGRSVRLRFATSLTTARARNSCMERARSAATQPTTNPCFFCLGCVNKFTRDEVRVLPLLRPRPPACPGGGAGHASSERSRRKGRCLKINA